VVGEKCGLTLLVLVNAQSVMHTVFQIYDVLRFDSTVVINVLINMSSPNLNSQFFFYFEAECINMLLDNLNSELFCSCKRRKFIGKL